MSLRHSPGPWHSVLNRRGQWEIFSQTHALVCRLAKWTPAIDAADARLIAVAPSLLDALKTLHDAVVHHGLTEGDGPAWLSAFQDVMTALRASETAIQKAEGREP